MIQDKVYIGTDNGLSGGIVAIKNGKIILKIIMPVINSTKTRREYNLPEIAAVFRKLKNDNEDIIVALEKSLIVPMSGRLSIVSTSFCFGMMRGMLTALKIPYVIVSARVWQKAIFVGMDRKDTKLASITYCTRLYPEEDFKATERCKKLHDGITDALCLAKYVESTY